MSKQRAIIEITLDFRRIINKLMPKKIPNILQQYFQMHFLKEYDYNIIDMPLRFVHGSPIYNKSLLLQVMV